MRDRRRREWTRVGALVAAWLFALQAILASFVLPSHASGFTVDGLGNIICVEGHQNTAPGKGPHGDGADCCLLGCAAHLAPALPGRTGGVLGLPRRIPAPPPRRALSLRPPRRRIREPGRPRAPPAPAI